MIKKKPLIFALLTGLLLAGCGGDDSATSEQEKPGTADAAETPAGSGTDTRDDSSDDHGFQDGDQLSIVIGSAPGGGSDSHARVFAPYLETALAEVTGKQITVVIENREGGRNRLAAEFTNAAEPDGLTIFHIASASLLVQNEIFEDANYSSTEMTPIASFGRSSRGIAYRTSLELPTDDLAGLAERSQTSPILLGTPLPADVQLLQQFLSDADISLDVDEVPIQTAEGATAMLRGELDAQMTTATSLQPFVEDNPDELSFLLTLNCERDPALPDVPSITELDISTADEICRLVGGDDRVFVGPPGIPDATVTALEESFLMAMSDEEYVATADEAGYVQGSQGADEVREAIASQYEIWSDFEPEIDS